MTRDEVLQRFAAERAVFDTKVDAVPSARFEEAGAARGHSVKDIVAHVAAYEELIVERLRAARAGETTAFDRDRDGWEVFNDRIWAEAATRGAREVVEHARAVYADLIEEVSRLTDEELAGRVGVSEALDDGWLAGRQLWELLGIDGFEHYPMHYEALEAAAG